MGRAAVPSGASTGNRRNHRAARWRQEPLSGQGRAQGRQKQHQPEISEAVLGWMPLTVFPGQDHSRPRRHRAKKPPGCQRHAGCLDGRGPRCCRRSLPAAVPYFGGMSAHPGDARTHDERGQRRRTPTTTWICRADDHPRGRTFVPRSPLRWGAEFSMHSRKSCTTKGMGVAVGDEGGLPQRRKAEAAISR